MSPPTSNARPSLRLYLADCVSACRQRPTRDERLWTMEAVVHPPAEGERHIAGESEILIKATGNETAGTFFLSESTIAPGFPGPPMHRHERLVDMFYVLEGFSPYVSARTRTSSRRDRS